MTFSAHKWRKEQLTIHLPGQLSTSMKIFSSKAAYATSPKTHPTPQTFCRLLFLISILWTWVLTHPWTTGLGDMSLWLIHSSNSAWVPNLNTPCTCHLWNPVVPLQEGILSSFQSLQEWRVSSHSTGALAGHSGGTGEEEGRPWTALADTGAAPSWCGIWPLQCRDWGLWGCGRLTPACQAHQEPTLMMRTAIGAQPWAQPGLGTKSNW